MTARHTARTKPRNRSLLIFASRGSMYVTASAGGGGSTPDSGSVVSLWRRPGRTNSSTASRMNGIDGRMLRARTLFSGRWCASSCCSAPRTMPPTSASGMLDSPANTAQADAATISSVKLFESTTLNSGASSTPAMPASTLDNSHENLETRSALMPFSSTRRWLSTTARIRRPMGVHRNRTVSTITVAERRDEGGDTVGGHREVADVEPVTQGETRRRVRASRPRRSP